MTAKAWASREDAYLRDRYVADGAITCGRALGRSFGSVTRRAQRLGVIRVRRWSEKDDARLRILWGTRRLEDVAAALGRSTDSVYWRAKACGLGVGCPQGFEYLSTAAERTGYAVAQLRRILNWAHVHVTRATTRPGRQTRTDHVHWVIEPADVDEAVAAWHRTETLEGASACRGLCSTVVSRLLRAAAARGDTRVPPRPRFRRHWRLPTELVDELVAEMRAEKARRESVKAAAARVGVTSATLAGWLAAAGVTYSRVGGVDPAEVDRVVAARRLTSSKAWRTRRAAA